MTKVGEKKDEKKRELFSEGQESQRIGKLGQAMRAIV